jgi:hypothetical protein
VFHAHLQIYTRGLCTRRAGRKNWQWRRRQRAGKQYKSPISPYIPSLRRNMG